MSHHTPVEGTVAWAFAPGTGTPESGGLLPREAFRLLHQVAREGLAGMEGVGSGGVRSSTALCIATLAKT